MRQYYLEKLSKINTHGVSEYRAVAFVAECDGWYAGRVCGLSPAVSLSFKRGRRHKQVRLHFCSGEESRIAPIHKETRQ